MLTKEQATDIVDRVQAVCNEWGALTVFVVAYEDDDGVREMCVSHNAACGHQLVDAAHNISLAAVDLGCDGDEDEHDAGLN